MAAEKLASACKKRQFDFNNRYSKNIRYRQEFEMARKFGKDFKHLELKGYRNINELYEQDSQLHACETLFGDWNAEVMVLAQDAANFNSLKKLLDADNKNPFRHSPTNNTNKNLYNILFSLNRFDMGEFCKPKNRNCGLYYANAIWLLKESEGMSGAITNKEKAYKINQEVFAETLNNLKKLKLIVTLGEHSFNFIKLFFKKQIEPDWHSTVKERMVHKVQGKNSLYGVVSLYHTSNRGMIARAKLNGVAGKNSCAKGIEVTMSDLKEIFISM